jgi:hypothetical protein
MFAFFPLRLLVALTFALTATSTSLSNVLRPFDEENDLSQIIRLSNGSTPTPHPETVGQLFPNTINEHPFLNIFRRQDPACWTDTAGNTNYCSTNNRCCGDPSNINNGWCCGMDAACGGYSGTDYCTYFTCVILFIRLIFPVPSFLS